MSNSMHHHFSENNITYTQVNNAVKQGFVVLISRLAFASEEEARAAFPPKPSDDAVIWKGKNACWWEEKRHIYVACMDSENGLLITSSAQPNLSSSPWKVDFCSDDIPITQLDKNICYSEELWINYAAAAVILPKEKYPAEKIAVAIRSFRLNIDNPIYSIDSESGYDCQTATRDVLWSVNQNVDARQLQLPFGTKILAFNSKNSMLPEKNKLLAINILEDSEISIDYESPGRSLKISHIEPHNESVVSPTDKEKASEFYGVSKTAFFATYWKNQAKSKDNWPELVQKLGIRQTDLFKDPFMRHFVDQEIGDEAEQRLDKKMWLPMATRTRFFRRTVSQAVKERGIKQVILLGSGFDTLSVRKEKYSRLYGVKFFEVDQANILDCKQAIYKKYNLNPNAEYVRIDYVKEDLIDQLCNHAVDFSKPTIILWEGNTFYLEKEDVVRILQNLAQHFSHLIMTFDYMHPALATIKTMQEEFTKRQSPLKTFFEPEELIKLCESLGLQCVDHKTAAKLAEEYEVDQAPYVTASMYSMVTCSNK